MKSLFLFLVILFLIGGCKENTGVDPSTMVPEHGGNVALNFDKASIPLEVASISVVLSRQGYDSLKKQINVETDSSAQVKFENIPVGTWKIEIKAYGSDNTVKYAGSTEAIIYDGMVTNVFLTLQPVLTGVGSVKIIINWGGTPPIINWKNWIQNSSNPVLMKDESNETDLGAAQPFVFFVDGDWKMTYASIKYDTAAKRNVAGIGLATTTDGGNTWKKNSKPIVTAGISSWSTFSVTPGPIFRVGNQYKMMYTGTDITQRYRIGIASSSNGIDWESLQSPLFTSLGQWDFNLVAGDMITVNGTYYFYFSCRSSDPYSFSIGLATSTDGITWTRHGTTPVLTASQQWEGQGVYFPSVIYDNGKFIMMYSSTSALSSPAFGMATSADGIHWTKLENNPVITKGISHSVWASTEISYPSFKKINGSYRAYYTGFRWQSIYPEWSIGFASLQQ